MSEDTQTTRKDEYQVRLEKLSSIKEQNINPYPEKFDKQNNLSEIKNSKEGTQMKTAGRIMTMRVMGKLAFCSLQDWSGFGQIALRQDELGERFDQFQEIFDRGDFIGVEGKVFTTHKGEKTILVENFTFLGKALLPLPEKWHGLVDEEAKYRQRYLDLLANEDSKKRFKFRSDFIKHLRNFYWEHSFEEVDTPVLANEASGALAKPFKTHHNALDMDMFMRIAPETYLKKCIIGGYDKVFEVARCFRNEGMDPSHLQEFTMIEHYAAYWNFEDNMRFTEKMFSFILEKMMAGKTTIEIPDREGNLAKIDFSFPWKKVSFRDLLLADADIDIDQFKTVEDLRQEIKNKNIDIEDIDVLGRGNLIDSLYKKVSRDKIINPTFLINHPLDLSPLARRNDDNPDIVDRFQLVINTWEIVNAYSELVDPLDQEQRFDDQMDAKEGGDEEAHGKDDEYVKSMKYGMPPISGWGMGIERVITLLTGQTNLKDLVLFPPMRPKGEKTNLKNTETLDLDIDRTQAKKLIEEHLIDEKTKLHSRETEVVMKALARELGQDEDKWGIIGLLHDIDWDITKDNTTEHGIKMKDILKEAGASNFLIETIASHTWGNKVCNSENLNKKRETPLQYLLAAGETVTGLIFALALMQPDKKLSSVELFSLKKKFKNKKFAQNCDRDIISECEQAGIKLDKFLEISLKSMQEISDELGL
jgi:lysyl-tRNA synthetase, class II